jgi:hypothetical protein
LSIGGFYLTGEFAHSKPDQLLVLQFEAQLSMNALAVKVKSRQNHLHASSTDHDLAFGQATLSYTNRASVSIRIAATDG